MSRFFDTAGQLTSQEREENLRCQREHRAHWVVVQREGNASAFNGYHWQPSAYSQIKCTADGCRRSWRTRAAYVANLPDAGKARS